MWAPCQQTEEECTGGNCSLWMLLCVRIAIKCCNDGSTSRDAALSTHHRLCLPGAEAARPRNCRLCGWSARNLLTWFAENRTGRCLRGWNSCTISVPCTPVDEKVLWERRRLSVFSVPTVEIKGNKNQVEAVKDCEIL